jgi:hypothetical protein
LAAFNIHPTSTSVLHLGWSYTRKLWMTPRTKAAYLPG